MKENKEANKQVTDKEKDPDTAARERERIRVARAAVLADRKQFDDGVQARDKEQRRRAAAFKERSRADREAARGSARPARPVSAINIEARESAWVD
jgi:hypothetical protein